MNLKNIFIFFAVSFLLQNGGFCESKPLPRIVSLSSAVSESIYLLGAQDQLVGRTEFCNRPPEILAKEKVGTVVEVNVEKIVSLRPDWVIATTLLSPRDRGQMEKMGLPLKLFPTPGDFDGICEQFLTLAHLLGKEKEAEKIVTASRARVEELKQRVLNKSKPCVFLELGDTPLITVTRDSFISEMIDSAAGVNIAKDAPSARYSREAVLKENPDVILAVLMDGKGPYQSRIKVWKQYPFLKAVKENRVFELESDLVCSPTVATYPDALQKILEFLHPDAK